jgi:hypothetical protein
MHRGNAAIIAFAQVQRAKLGAPHNRAAFASIVLNTGSSSPGELEMT